MAEVAEFRDFRLVEKHESWTAGGPVVSRLPEPEIEALEGRASATVAEPGTLAWFGFATGTWMTGAVLGGFVGAAAEPALGVVLLLFAGLGQFIGGLYAFRRANTLAGSVFCCFGAYSVMVGLMLLFQASGLVPRAAGSFDVLGWLNFSFAFIALALLLASVRRNMVMAAVLLFLACGYTLTGIGVLGLTPTATLGGGVAIAGGILLFISAFFAYYLGSALVVNSTWTRRVLPIFGEA